MISLVSQWLESKGQQHLLTYICGSCVKVLYNSNCSICNLYQVQLDSNNPVCSISQTNSPNNVVHVLAGDKF